jgi:Uma2 family endonuclease
MAETDLHREEMVDLIAGLQRRYRPAPDVYVAGNLFFYFRQGDPRAVVAPDVFLVRGVPKGRRRVYKLWEEGKVPALVIEVTSDSTRNEDLTDKKRTYERLGVEEYFLHDPLGDYLNPRLQGHRLSGSRYKAMRPMADGSLQSRTTGLTLRVEGPKLRLIDTASGEPLPWVEELDARVLEAGERAEIEAAARRAADAARQIAAAGRRVVEEELARLRRELEGRKGD